MQNNNSIEKYNIILGILFFIIPILAVNASFYFFADINIFFARSEQEKSAIHEAEILGVEADFRNQFSGLFKKFFDRLKGDSEINLLNEKLLIERLEQNVKSLYKDPFPKYSLYVFKIDYQASSSELIFSKGDIKGGKRGLCLAFDYLLTLSKENKDINSLNRSKSFAKNLLGQNTNINSIATELRGMPVYINNNNQFSLFIWDYFLSKNNVTYGSMLICEELEKHSEYGRLLALRNLSSRGIGIGAFLPIYKEYGKAIMQYPLEKSKLFNEWAEKLTIKEEVNLEYWLKKSLPQRVPLGNYTAYCHLERGASHIAVVLVKAIKDIRWPKWLISFNLLISFLMIIFLFCGIVYGYWPKINLTVRFTLLYLLAAFLPLSLLFIISYGYLVKYQNTSENQLTSELQSVLKSFDAEKTAILREYRSTFVKAINDEQVIKLIEDKGIEDIEVVKRVLDIFENNKNYLPILGVKILDESGRGAFIKSNTASNVDAESIVNALLSTQVKVLRRKLEEEYPDAKDWMKDYDIKNKNEDLANRGYETVTGQPLHKIVSNHLSTPISRRTGDDLYIHIFDYIKINNKARYSLLVTWDDKALDDSIVQKAFDNYALKYSDYNFAGFRIKAQKIDNIGRKTRHVSQKLWSTIKEKAKLVSLENKSNVFKQDNNIVFVMPSLSFSRMVFVGWIDRTNIDISIFVRRMFFLSLAVLSIIILLLCSIRSASVFLKPVNELKKALDEVIIGNLNVSLKNPPNDELGQLSNEFSNMINSLREKERLSKLISDQAVQAMKKQSDILFDNTETFNGVALVSDIRNFTGMSEQYDPVLITNLLNEHFAEMAKIISDNGGLIYKFIGDAIEAVFPEKAELELSASERAFRAGSMMINQLSVINKKRENNNLFTYKIGVGLCYGKMFSGYVGSLETRLDYSILGEPLKSAAKYEALSIKNPSFPLVIGVEIAEKLVKYGFSFLTIDSKGQDFIVYTVDADKDKDLFYKYNFLSKLSDIREKDIENSELPKENKVFSLQSDNKRFINNNGIWFSWFVIFITSVFITLGFNFIYTNSFNNLRIDSDKECSRLIEQLNCDEVLKTSFEALCFNFYEDLYKAINFDNSEKSKKELIDNIYKNYEKKKITIPKFCCCLFDSESSSKDYTVINKGFSSKISELMSLYSLAEIEDNDEKKKDILSKLIGKDTDLFTMRGVFNRRSALATIDNQDIFFDTERIYKKDLSRLMAYVFCGMPKEMPDERLAEYYKVLAGKSILLAFNCGNEWVFSDNFPNDEKEFLKDNLNNYKIINKKGYKTNQIKIGNKIWSLFVIKKELAAFYFPKFWLILSVFIITILAFFICSLVIKKLFISSIDSLSGKLKINMITFTILPLFIVVFLSYLYVSEDYSVNKTETKFRLNKLMDEVENKDLYYQPFCLNILDNISKSEKLKKYVKEINSCVDKEKKEILVNQFNLYLDKNFVGKIKEKYKVNPFFSINEIIISGKDGWVSSSRKGEFADKNDKDTSLSDIGKFISAIGKSIYFKGNESLKKAVESDVAEGLINTLSSIFGAEFALKFVNLPRNLIMVNASFSIVAFYTSAMPSIKYPEYILQAFIFISNELKPKICNLKNDETISLKKHYATGSKDEKLFCFYSPNISVGEFFFYNYGNFPNTREDLNTVKELGLAASWINSSFVPVSREVELFGKHFLEARKGNIISDNVYAALASEIPIREKAYLKFLQFALVVFISIIMIYFITQNIISDLLAPVNMLIEGAKSVALEDYKFRTNYIRKDELGVLCESFDKMMKGLEEKQLMNRMVSKTALKVSSNATDVASRKINVVLLYVTVPGFDKIMKKTSIYELFDKLRRQVADISEIVIANGGDIDKIMGEKMLIAFHINDKKSEDVAVLACKAASMIEKSEKNSFKVSVGVNYGQVISGFLGVGEKRDFTIIGDPVNVAARIAVLGEKLEKDNCLISETIYYYINNQIKANLYGEVELKGKSQPMKVYQLI